MSSSDRDAQEIRRYVALMLKELGFTDQEAVDILTALGHDIQAADGSAVPSENSRRPIVRSICEFLARRRLGEQASEEEISRFGDDYYEIIIPWLYGLPAAAFLEFSLQPIENLTKAIKRRLFGDLDLSKSQESAPATSQSHGSILQPAKTYYRESVREERHTVEATSLSTHRSQLRYPPSPGPTKFRSSNLSHGTQVSINYKRWVGSLHGSGVAAKLENVYEIILKSRSFETHFQECLLSSIERIQQFLLHGNLSYAKEHGREANRALIEGGSVAIWLPIAENDVALANLILSNIVKISTRG